MALKYRITKAAHSKLGDEMQAEYKADGDTHFVLDVSGLEDTDALKRAKDRADQEVVDLKADLAEANKKVKTLETAAGEGGQDVARLTRSHERKIATITETHEGVVGKLHTFIKGLLQSGKAKELATSISSVPSLMAEHIEKRLDVDFTGDEPKLIIKNKDGAADPAMTMDKLKSELVANPEFKSILVGNRATGSAAPHGVLPGAGATSPNNADAKADVNAMSGADFTALVRARREAAQQNAGSGQA